MSCLVLVSGCGQSLDVGSDVLWTSRFEDGTFDEWESVPFGNASANPQPLNSIEVSSEFAYQGKFAAKLTTIAPGDNPQGFGASLVRNGGLPVQAYYSAWYYLPNKETVGSYWVIMKFRTRDDTLAEHELYDVNLKNLPNGDMSLRLYDHRVEDVRVGGNLPLTGSDPQIPVGSWFQLEAFYRADPTNGHLTLWLDGKEILDHQGPTGPTPWVAWDVVSVAELLTPEQALLYVDDCAISQTRVGPNGLIAK